MPGAGEASTGLAGALLAGLFLLLSGTADPGAQAWAEEKEPQVLAPGWTELEFESPEAGSYRLPPMGMAGDGQVLDSDGNPASLHGLMGDKVVVLSFIYSSCSDANGCPLATHVLERLQDQLLEDPAKGGGVRFISLSFDPVQDTPEVMKRYGRPYISGDFDWRFLTTRGEKDLVPILESYGQSIVRDPGAPEDEAGNISHVLRVFLVDRQLQIRNIFSASYLHADTMLNDIRTLQLEAAGKPVLQGPGDDKEGYESAAYRTRAQSLEYRRGSAADLWAYAGQAPLGLPPIPQPDDNPLSPEKIELGRLLFFDRRLSHNNTFSCAMCHVPEQGFTSNELATAVGIEGRTVRRNSPTIYNVAYLRRLFHDGRESTLEQQVWGPLLARNEMGNPSVGRVIDQVRAIPEYAGLFAAAFDGRPVSMETVGMALASYERVLVSANSRFDRWYFGDEEQALSDEEQAGFRLFTGKAACSTCHSLSAESALFTDNLMHNTGIGYQGSMLKSPVSRRVQIAPGEHITVRGDVVADASEPAPGDLGLYEITENPDDRWKYRTPSLRNVALTAPYMHDGSLSTLEDVVDFYNRGGIPNELLDPLLRPLNLDESESAQLLAFLRALTGDNVDELVADAFAVPVGNTGSGQSPGTAVSPDNPDR
jgi:cytochrome c peroxidase